MSSTVWWASISMSPARARPPDRTRRGARTRRACATGTARGVSIARRPLPSSSSSTLICVSFVLRSIRRACAPRLLVSGGHRSYKRSHGSASASCLLVVRSLVACGGRRARSAPEKPVAEGRTGEAAAAAARPRRIAKPSATPPRSRSCPTAARACRVALKERGAPRSSSRRSAAMRSCARSTRIKSRLLGPVGCWKVEILTRAAR